MDARVGSKLVKIGSKNSMSFLKNWELSGRRIRAGGGLAC